MSFEYDINMTHGFALIRATGFKWTGPDLLDSAKEVELDERFEPDFDWVYDLRSVHSTVIGPEDMNELLELFRTYREGGRVDSESRSVIVAGEANLRMTGVLYKHKADRPDELFMIVDTMEEARAWLGIDGSASVRELEE